jgi:hypothetical protein
MADMAGFPEWSFLADNEARRTAKPPAFRQNSSSQRSNQIGTACFIPAQDFVDFTGHACAGAREVNVAARWQFLAKQAQSARH